MGWSSYNPHYSSLLLYQDKYGSTERPLGTQQSPYMTSSGEKSYGVKGQSYLTSPYQTRSSLTRETSYSHVHAHAAGDDSASTRRSHAAALHARLPYASSSSELNSPYTSEYSWEVQRAKIQTEVPYSRSVHAGRPPPAPGGNTVSKCSKCSCKNCGSGGCGGGSGRGGLVPYGSNVTRDSAHHVTSLPTSNIIRSNYGGSSNIYGSTSRNTHGSSSSLHLDTDKYGESSRGLHRRFRSKRIGTTSSPSYEGYSDFNRPTRRFTVAGIYS